jgi:hypothetical protein
MFEELPSAGDHGLKLGKEKKLRFLENSGIAATSGKRFDGKKLGYDLLSLFNCINLWSIVVSNLSVRVDRRFQSFHSAVVHL